MPDRILYIHWKEGHKCMVGYFWDKIQFIVDVTILDKDLDKHT